MKRHTPPFAIFITTCLVTLLGARATEVQAAGIGESGSDIWVDGPDVVQPGVDRTFPDAAVDPSANLVFVWNAFNAAGGNRNDIFMRRFDAAGTALGDPVLINTTIDLDQIHARVAISNDGSFLVVWQSFEQDPEESPGVERIFVRSQAFDADGDPVGTEQLLSTELTKQATDANADVAALTGGGYAVVWRSNNSPGLETDQYIEARLVNADGTPDGPEFKANASEGPNVNEPAVTELADGGFLAVWAGSGVEVQGRRFMADGTPVGGDFQINTLTEGTEAEPDAALHGDGRVMVVWKTQEIAEQDREIRGRIFSSTLQADGNDFRINTLTDGVQDNPKVGDYGRGGFFVAWESAVSAGNDNDPRSIQGRVVTGSNQFVTADFQINRWIAGNQERPGLSGRGDRVAVAWRSASSEDSPADDVITAQGWSVCGIFCDGFE